MRHYTNIALAGLLAAGLASAQNSTAVKCVAGLKMFVSRGTNETTPLGYTVHLVEKIASQINGSDYEPIMYPAAFDNPPYFVSVANGTALLKNAIVEYAEACPNSKIALFGYSQGAQITTNALCGVPPIWAWELGTSNASAETIIKNAMPLPEMATKNIVSIVLFGDPTHRNDTTYNYGNATGNGIFFRPASPSCDKLGSRIRSYCNVGDPFCDVEAPPSVTVHGQYIQSNGEEAGLFVIEQYKNGGKSDGSNTSGNKGPSTTSAPSGVPTSAGNSVTPMVISALVGAVMVLCMI